MIVAAHLEKIERFEDLRQRLNKVNDFALWFWVIMNSGTNALNAALHCTGVTEAVDCYPVQPRLYLEPGYPPGTFTPVLRPLGDVIHADRPRIETTLPSEVDRIRKAIEIIESYRDPCIRFGRAATPDVIKTCETAYLECLSLTRQVVAASKAAAK